jgi:hypothetical protein
MYNVVSTFISCFTIVQRFIKITGSDFLSIITASMSLICLKGIHVLSILKSALRPVIMAISSYFRQNLIYAQGLLLCMDTSPHQMPIALCLVHLKWLLFLETMMREAGIPLLHVGKYTSSCFFRSLFWLYNLPYRTEPVFSDTLDPWLHIILYMPYVLFVWNVLVPWLLRNRIFVPGLLNFVGNGMPLGV